MLNPALRYAMSERLRKFALVFLVSSTLGVLYYIYLHYSETGLFPRLVEHMGGFGLSILIANTIGFLFFAINHWLDRWISWKTFFVARFVAGYVLHTLIGIGLVSAVAYLLSTMSAGSILWENFSTNDPDVLVKLIILFLVTNFIYSIVYSLLFSYKQYAVTQIDSLQSERKQLELQFEALKSQLSPHYLFNSLNTISSLIYKDPQSAEQFIRRLAQTYQYILATQHKRYVLLKDEIDFVQSYYYLLRIRFQQALTVEINLPKSVLNSQIPPLTLQILVENAVKHNAISPEKPMFIYISALDNTHVRVINTKSALPGAATSFRIGLENIKKRYQYFTDKRIEVKDTDKFMVSLPVLMPRHPETNHKISA
jgi:two-component system LytT family sensor kinase